MKHVEYYWLLWLPLFSSVFPFYSLCRSARSSSRRLPFPSLCMLPPSPAPSQPPHRIFITIIAILQTASFTSHPAKWAFWSLPLSSSLCPELSDVSTAQTQCLSVLQPRPYFISPSRFLLWPRNRSGLASLKVQESLIGWPHCSIVRLLVIGCSYIVVGWFVKKKWHQQINISNNTGVILLQLFRFCLLIQYISKMSAYVLAVHLKDLVMMNNYIIFTENWSQDLGVTTQSK